MLCFFITVPDNKSGPLHKPGEPATKLQDFFESSKVQEVMKAASKHTDLLEANEVLAQDQYFEKLEKKEQLELKMMETYKVPCKAIHCAKVGECLSCTAVMAVVAVPTDMCMYVEIHTDWLYCPPRALAS
jgi:predicted transcriptional regulator